MLNIRQAEVQTLFKFDKTFYTKLKILAKKENTSMKVLVEKHMWPIINEKVTLKDEFSLLNRTAVSDPELSSIGIHIKDKEKRMKTDNRFAELAAL